MRGGEIVNSDSARDGPRGADLDLASDSVTVWHRSDSKHGSDSEQLGNNQSKNLLGPESIAAVVEDDHNRNRGCPARPVQTMQLCCAAFGTTRIRNRKDNRTDHGIVCSDLPHPLVNVHFGVLGHRPPMGVFGPIQTPPHGKFVPFSQI